MLHSTFILSLLASVVSAQGSSLPADSVLPSFAIVTLGATIKPQSSIAPIVTPPSTPVDDDQPDPYNSSIQIPASESFNPSNAPAFIPSAGVPNPSSNPVFPSTPCSSQVTSTPMPVDDDQPDPYNSSIQVPASESFDPSKAPAFTAISSNPVYPSTPCSNEATSTSTLPVQTPAPAAGNNEDEPCDEELLASASPTVSTSISPAPVPLSAFPPFSTASVSPPPAPLSAFPSFPTIALPALPIGGPRPTRIGLPSGRPAFGWGRPRPSGAWPSRGAAHPTLGYGRRPRPSASSGLPSRPVAGKGYAATTPCTLETRVRATPTAV